MRSTLASIIVACISTRCHAFLLPYSSVVVETGLAGSLSRFYASNKDDNENETNGPHDESFQEKLDSFLDTPFFDPQSKDNGPLLKWFAELVESDYELAEALYVGLLFVILVVGAQELLRFQLYGNSYIPFRAGVGSKLW